MKARREVQGEAGHSRSKEHKEGVHDQLESSLVTPQEVDKVLENLAPKTFWDDQTFEELLKDEGFLKMLDAACKSVISRFKPITGYGWEDLKQDVLVKLRDWRPQFPGEKPSKRLLQVIARNNFIDKLRKSGEQSCSFESLYEVIDAEERSREIPCDHDDQAAIQSRIRLQELIDKLGSEAERELLSKYLYTDKDVTEIALELGISRQAVAKKLARIYRKLEPYA